jgi:hypothetical protein
MAAAGRGNVGKVIRLQNLTFLPDEFNVVKTPLKWIQFLRKSQMWRRSNRVSLERSVPHNFYDHLVLSR